MLSSSPLSPSLSYYTSLTPMSPLHSPLGPTLHLCVPYVQSSQQKVTPDTLFTLFGILVLLPLFLTLLAIYLLFRIFS